MNKKNELVTKGAMDKALRELWDSGMRLNWNDIKSVIYKLPAVLPNSRQAGEIKSPEEIERAIEHFKKDSKNTQDKEEKFHNEICIICLGWVLNQEEQIFGKAESGKVGG